MKASFRGEVRRGAEGRSKKEIGAGRSRKRKGAGRDEDGYVQGAKGSKRAMGCEILVYAGEIVIPVMFAQKEYYWKP